MYFSPENTSEEIIEAFIQLLEIQPFLFEKDWMDLSKLTSNFPDDVLEISKNLIIWCQQREQVFDALDNLLNYKGVSGFIPKSGKEYKILIQNSIRQSFPQTYQQHSGLAKENNIETSSSKEFPKKSRQD